MTLLKKKWKTTMENAEWLLNIVWQSFSWGPSQLETNGVSFYVSQTKENNGAFVPALLL